MNANTSNLEYFKFPDIGINSEKLKTPTVEEIEEIRSKAYQEAYEKAYIDAYQKANEEIEATKKQLRSLIEWINFPLDSISDKLEENLNHLVKEICLIILRRTLEINPKIIVSCVKEGLEILKDHQRYRVFLCSTDFQMLRKFFPDLNQILNGSQILEDPFLKPGDFRIQTDISQLDGLLESRVNSVINNIKDNPNE